MTGWIVAASLYVLGAFATIETSRDVYGRWIVVARAAAWPVLAVVSFVIWRLETGLDR